ncbi:bacterial regulatory helix-turn-helix protein, lysR family [Methanobrevibacter cuticularis]|uniref:Bacterial regulatory helix-turn-helix protein, lysR family n=1 Tax=Methanobrevibacter cuticularis TaxID=47311 RepID=A0A166CLH7_9EURY|nr:LysR family transcriptional regulator [Methanobrevibacter cuticularis]KZX15237.1 bacterial regulatory helix-turn-helix protein, lysR family [Methanobrevibacter cuticularis]
MKINPQISLEINGKSYSYSIFESLDSLSRTKSQRKTAKELNIAHSVLNRRIKNAEKNLGFRLVNIRGSRSYLSLEAVNLLNRYQKYANSLKKDEKIAIAGGHIVTGLLESISESLPCEIDIYSSSDQSAYKLAKRGFIDILALDDPLIAFVNDLDFTAIAYDHLVLVSNDNFKNDGKNTIKNIEDLKNLKFVSVHGTAQRLAWKTLYENNIPFKIVKEVRSEFDAFKIVKNSNDLYTFLNASYFKGENILKNETQHVISLVNIDNNLNKDDENDDTNNLNQLIEYIINECQELIANQGFKPIKPWKIPK